MKLLEVMERVGSRDVGRIKAYIKDAFDEMATLIPEKTTGQFINVAASQREYSLPTGYIKILGIYKRYDSNNKYIRIERVGGDLMLDQLSSTVVGSTTDFDIIVV